MRLVRCIFSLLASLSLVTQVQAENFSACDALTTLKEIAANLDAGLPAQKNARTKSQLDHIAVHIRNGNFDKPPAPADLAFLRGFTARLAARVQAAAAKPDQKQPGKIRAVSQGLSRIDAIEVNLKCRKPDEMAGVPGASKDRSGPADQASDKTFLERLNDPNDDSAAPILIALAVIAGSTSLSVYHFVFKTDRRRYERRSCHTPVLITYNDQCTVSYILDIGRGGTKIEAPKNAVPEEWLDLYFCGNRVRGKAVWRNKFFIGFKFEQPVANSIVEDVVSGSVKSPRTDGIEKNASSCYAPGCHLTCPRHVPTTISQKGTDKSA